MREPVLSSLFIEEFSTRPPDRRQTEQETLDFANLNVSRKS
jgi:hypothetical protein